MLFTRSHVHGGKQIAHTLVHLHKLSRSLVLWQ
jgi:hypothetical protein